ncbi:MAG: iron-sulfur cluster assembly protein [Bacteroidales bacterium]|nr:iron-sulfur cluster assembly protein [Bacteroidales bacterium]
MEEATKNIPLLGIETQVIDVLRTVYDPEIPVNVYDLGLIYRIDVDDDNNVEIDMTFTAPNCPIADEILVDVQTKIEGIKDVKSCKVNIVFEPAWDQSMMSEEAKEILDMDFD